MSNDDVRDFQIDAAQEETDSALRHVAQLLNGRSADEVAWWMCANHARFVIDNPNVIDETRIIGMAKRAGTPPRGENWQDWLDRVRNLKPHDLIRQRT